MTLGSSLIAARARQLQTQIEGAGLLFVGSICGLIAIWLSWQVGATIFLVTLGFVSAKRAAVAGTSLRNLSSRP